MTKIRFCENNFGEGVEEVMKKLDEEEIEYEVEPCLGHCGDCAMGPIATLDDELITAETPDDLYDEIKNMIE